MSGLEVAFTAVGGVHDINFPISTQRLSFTASPNSSPKDEYTHPRSKWP